MNSESPPVAAKEKARLRTGLSQISFSRARAEANGNAPATTSFKKVSTVKCQADGFQLPLVPTASQLLAPSQTQFEKLERSIAEPMQICTNAEPMQIRTRYILHPCRMYYSDMLAWAYIVISIYSARHKAARTTASLREASRERLRLLRLCCRYAAQASSRSFSKLAFTTTALLQCGTAALTRSALTEGRN